MSDVSKVVDIGLTSLMSGERVPKNHPIVELLGELDELVCRLGMAKVNIDEYGYTLSRYQETITKISGHVASQFKGSVDFLNQELYFLDVLIVEYNSDVAGNFKSLPLVNSINSGYLHLARCSCRSAERKIVSLISSYDVDFKVLLYINRLSDVLYLMAKITDIKKDDILGENK